MKFAAIAILSALGLSSGAWATEATKLPVPEVETLPNGLRLVWFLNDKLPVVDMSLLVLSGFRDDPAGKSGTAELLSASLDRGAGGLSAQEIAHSVEMLGASRYESSEDETFTIGMHGLAPDAPVLMEILSKIALQPTLAESEVSREKTRILERWNHVPDYGETLAGLAFHRILTGNTPYGRGSFLTASEFAKVSREDVVQFHRANFTPKNSILMIVGQVNKETFRQKIIDLFGAWQGEAPKHDPRSYADKRLPQARATTQVVVVDRPDLNQAQVRFGMKAPSIKAPEHYSLVVANALLGEYFNSRLNSLIRDKLGLTYSISSSFGYSRELANFTISSATRNESVGQLVQKTVGVLRELKAGPIPKEEVEMAKNYLEGGFPLGTSTLGAVASRWLAGLVFELGPDYLNEFIPRVHSVSNQDVFAAVGKDFDLDHLVIVVSGDAKAIEKSFKDVKGYTLKRVTPKELM
ncbi:MAG: M16 family metallopeptidase [Bdellovibrionota bacterium]